ncbi:MOSC domain-containing protein [Comamonas flocculans]|uniref:MOSC domain-containing protein n=1 Tax=Comamonas flocculans TaxID=2597701 RepID=A0A5B8RVX8_9BURK|nr:MOSC domain-containing protein [Comamonas flocculans]QEA12888.1 MOSC domain-containing protein [Comamonas flocculans]
MQARVLGTLHTVLRGPARPYSRLDGRDGGLSGIAKHAVDGPVQIGSEGLAGDEQGDRRVHGGPDKAVHHYALEHYDVWRRELGPLAVLQAPPAFGENFSGTGVTEAGICLGDRLRVGSCVLQVSQSRQPCWKLNTRFGRPDMALRVQQSGRTGWYYRVLEPGQVQAGDALTLLERPHPDWPLSRIIGLLYVQVLDFAQLRELARLPLPPSWQKLVRHRLERQSVEDWDRRTLG